MTHFFCVRESYAAVHDVHSTKNSHSLSLSMFSFWWKNVGSAGIWEVQLVKPPKAQFSYWKPNLSFRKIEARKISGSTFMRCH